MKLRRWRYGHALVGVAATIAQRARAFNHALALSLQPGAAALSRFVAASAEVARRRAQARRG